LTFTGPQREILPGGTRLLWGTGDRFEDLRSNKTTCKLSYMYALFPVQQNVQITYLHKLKIAQDIFFFFNFINKSTTYMNSLYMLRCEINAFMNYAYKFSFLTRTISDWNSLHPEAYRATTPESFQEIIQRLQT
jgi:hypothetical protein